MPDISATLVSNSTQLDNVDLLGGARVFTITGVTMNESDQPLSIALAEYPRPWKPGVTMRRLLSEMWGPESDAWIGRKVRLFRDDKVTFGPQATGGTRISHASHLDKKVEVTLPISKGKFGKFVVEPLKDDAPQASSPPAESTADRAAKAVTWFAAKSIPQSSLEAHVGKPIAEWNDGDLTTLTADRDSIVGGVA